VPAVMAQLVLNVRQLRVKFISLMLLSLVQRHILVPPIVHDFCA